MDEHEKELIYQQMNQILKNINELMDNYNFWKKKINNMKLENETKKLHKNKESHFRKEIEYQKFIQRKRQSKYGCDYQTIALDIASVLKGSDIPLSTKQVHQELLIKGYMISYSNLSNNILQRIQSDSKINVERACRGYWQYRIKT